MLNALKKIRHYYGVLGAGGAAMFVFSKAFNRRPLFKTKVAGVKHPVYVRLGTTDASVMAQVLLEKHYDLAIRKAPKIIVDAGANIGLSAVYFANRFPEATIIALEPEASNFQLLKKNTALYPNIKPVHTALWGGNKSLKVIHGDGGHHGFQTVENASPDSKSIPALTLDSIMADFKLPRVDLLKIDIEGSEKEVFENCSVWIDKIDTIMIELHEHLKPGCTEVFHKATQGFPNEFCKGETVMRARHSLTA